LRTLSIHLEKKEKRKRKRKKRINKRKKEKKERREKKGSPCLGERSLCSCFMIYEGKRYIG